ncbi:hypothetical protein N7510_003849 [Penicillium lagena]|uniref:uncharacterized protein n=1 Tax=Penicillium lagena TaxID=94218 RepID=UPI0025401716|nr:uncharacterized protein N7510_003849 [Penicillium lagena]KAJ5619865.1 hypothetical protein N7510_003849 [Penicillium lagena]
MLYLALIATHAYVLGAAAEAALFDNALFSHVASLELYLLHGASGDAQHLAWTAQDAAAMRRKQ